MHRGGPGGRGSAPHPRGQGRSVRARGRLEPGGGQLPLPGRRVWPRRGESHMGVAGRGAQGCRFKHAAGRAVRAPYAREPPTRREAAAHGSRCAARLAVSSRSCAASRSISRVRDGVSRGWATALLGRPGLRPGARGHAVGPLALRAGGSAVGRGRCRAGTLWSLARAGAPFDRRGAPPSRPWLGPK